jgi:hypothetical protein
MSLGLRSFSAALLFRLGVADNLLLALWPLDGRGILVALTLILDRVVPFLVGGLESVGEFGSEGQSSDRESSQACDDMVSAGYRSWTDCRVGISLHPSSPCDRRDQTQSQPVAERCSQC